MDCRGSADATHRSCLVWFGRRYSSHGWMRYLPPALVPKHYRLLNNRLTTDAPAEPVRSLTGHNATTPLWVARIVPYAHLRLQLYPFAAPTVGHGLCQLRGNRTRPRPIPVAHAAPFPLYHVTPLLPVNLDHTALLCTRHAVTLHFTPHY